jgi:uncharacterized protein
MFFFTLVAAYLSLCALVYFNQRSLIYHPTPELPVETSKISSFNSADATLKLSVNLNTGDNALIYFGGNAENVSQSLAKYTNAFPDYAIYMLHYRSFSGSTGEPSETALYQDAEKLYALVKARHGNITVMGRSLGSGVAIRLAAAKPVAKLVLITPYDSLLNIAKQRFPYLPVEWMLIDRFESWRYAPKVKAPTIILAAETDQVIPMENSVALYKCFQAGIAAFKVVKNADHVSISTQPDYFSLMQSF